MNKEKYAFLIIMLFALLAVSHEISAATFSGSLSARNAPFGLENNSCANGPVLVASGLSAGDIVKLSNINGNYCTRSAYGVCTNNIAYGCQSNHLHSCRNYGAVKLSIHYGDNNPAEFSVQQALDGITVENRGTPGSISAYIFVRDQAGYYFDNNSAYKCHFSGNVTKVAPICTPHTTQKCVGNSVYWFDSCNAKEDLKQTCDNNQICSNGSCNSIACNSNSSCGPDTTEGSPFCAGNSVYKNFRTWTCNNPGTANSSCSSTVTPQLQNNCTGSQTCNASTGQCVNQNIACATNSDCNDNNANTQDICLNQGAPQSSCVHNPITCNSNSDCSSLNGYIGSPYCQNNVSVFQTYRTYTCQNSGAANSSCVPSDAAQLKTACPSNQICTAGSCTNYGNLVVSSYSTPNPAIPNQQVSFIAAVSGGTGNYTYQWSGACSGSGSTCNITFSNPGSYTVSLAVTSGSQTTYSTTTSTINAPTQNCSLQSYRQCYNGNLYWFDSCGNRDGISQYCNNGCSGNTCNNQNCAANSYRACYENAVYWYDSCGNRDGLFQTCNYNQICSAGNCIANNQNNNCTNYSYQRCVGSYLYWYDSCGNQQGQPQYCQYGCSGNICSNQNTYSNLTVTSLVKNLSNGTAWGTSVSATPSDVLMFMITLQAQGNQSAGNVFVRDILPYGLIYKNSLVVSGSSNYSGDITTGINLGTITAGQTVSITYQVQVAPSSSFNYGTSTLTSNISATVSGNPATVNNATVAVTRSAVYGASSISTGLTNNFWVDSFFLPLIITLILIWMWRSGMFFGIKKWASNKNKILNSYKSEKELKNRIALIRKSGEA